MSKSITSAPSFNARLLQADRWRLVLMGGCLLVLLAAMIVRRMLNGIVASNDSIFYPTIATLIAGGFFVALVLFDTERRRRRGLSLPWWRLILGGIFDLALPFALLLILQLNSPGDRCSALAAPALLIIPIVIMLSVLRLRPLFTLMLGISAAAVHWMLVLNLANLDVVEPRALPMLLSYGVLIAVTGVAASVLALFVRRYIEEAVVEAETAERASRYLATVEHELDIARDIQLGLLPSDPPLLEGFDIQGMSRPATKAGGDYYDWQDLPDGRLVAAIADVTGHGIGPALVMAVCRAYARATAPGSANAADFLKRLNDLVLSDVTEGRFVTMAVAIINSNGEVDLLSAGHGPTFLYRAATQFVEHFGGDGLPLGVAQGSEYAPTRHLRLDRGDAIVMLTDGFMERSRSDGEQFGTSRLLEIVKEHANQSASQLIQAIDTAVTAFAGGTTQSDDMTALVIRRAT